MEKLKLNDTEKFKGTWDGTNFSFERDRSFGFSWPQRNYTCSFCRKEYKSAQALGGHMNVHRRDRAKQLIQQSSPSQEISLTSKPNPNPNFTPPVLAKPVPSAARFLPYNYHASSSQHDDLLSTQIRDTRKKMGMEAYVYKIGEFEFNSSKNQENESRVWKKREVLGLDMKIGGQIRDVKEDLDLELRLGCS